MNVLLAWRYDAQLILNDEIADTLTPAVHILAKILSTSLDWTVQKHPISFKPEHPPVLLTCATAARTQAGGVEEAAQKFK